MGTKWAGGQGVQAEYGMVRSVEGCCGPDGAMIGRAGRWTMVAAGEEVGRPDCLGVA